MSLMRDRFLEVTFREGRAFAAYFHLPRRAGDEVARSRPVEYGLVIDETAEGRPIGIEITAPSALTLDAFNDLLRGLGLEAAEASELAPLHAA